MSTVGYGDVFPTPSGGSTPAALVIHQDQYARRDHRLLPDGSSSQTRDEGESPRPSRRDPFVGTRTSRLPRYCSTAILPGAGLGGWRVLVSRRAANRRVCAFASHLCSGAFGRMSDPTHALRRRAMAAVGWQSMADAANWGRAPVSGAPTPSSGEFTEGTVGSSWVGSGAPRAGFDRYRCVTGGSSPGRPRRRPVDPPSTSSHLPL